MGSTPDETTSDQSIREAAGMARWRDRVAIVTGASSGIGRAVALDLARAGMRVAAWARRVERLDALCRDAPEGRVLAQRVDLKDEAQILAAFDAVDARWGGADVLINNAGLGHHAPLTSGETAHWREMLEVNVLALCVCTREAIRRMNARGVDDGHVLHVSSMAAHRVPPGSGVYSATKYAVKALTEALRKELREGDSDIRVTSISPGFVETEFAAHYHKRPEAAEEAYGRYPVLTSEDVAAGVRYALSQPRHVQIHDVLMRPTRQER